MVPITRKLRLVTAALAVACLLPEKAICRPGFGDFKALAAGDHIPELRVLNEQEFKVLQNKKINGLEDERIDINRPGFGQQLRSHMVTLDDFKNAQVGDDAMKDRDAFVTALRPGRDPSGHYYLGDLLYHFYLWRKFKELDGWEGSITLRVKQALGNMEPQNVMLGDFLASVFHDKADNSASEQKFMEWLSRRHRDNGQGFLQGKLNHEFYHLRDLVENYVMWARWEKEEFVPNISWFLGQRPEDAASWILQAADEKGTFKYRRIIPGEKHENGGYQSGTYSWTPADSNYDSHKPYDFKAEYPGHNPFPPREGNGHEGYAHRPGYQENWFGATPQHGNQFGAMPHHGNPFGAMPQHGNQFGSTPEYGFNGHNGFPASDSHRPPNSNGQYGTHAEYGFPATDTPNAHDFNGNYRTQDQNGFPASNAPSKHSFNDQYKPQAQHNFDGQYKPQFHSFPNRPYQSFEQTPLKNSWKKYFFGMDFTMKLIKRILGLFGMKKIV